jgi:hypothetical protein
MKSIKMNYMTLVNQRLPEDVQEIILDMVFSETRWEQWKVKEGWCWDEIRYGVSNRIPNNCDEERKFYWVEKGINCSRKVCECNCSLSVETMDKLRTRKDYLEDLVCMNTCIKIKRVIGRKNAVFITWYDISHDPDEPQWVGSSTLAAMICDES